MKRQELISEVAANLFLPEETIELVLHGVADVVGEVLAAGGQVGIGRLGTFRVAQQVHTVRSQLTRTDGVHRYPVFRGSRHLKRQLAAGAARPARRRSRRA